LSALRLGTRGSALALAQASGVAEALQAEIVTVRTAGDRGTGPGDKSRWVGELEAALLRGEIDLACHSAKDVPGELAAGLELVGATERAPAEDVLLGTNDLDALPTGARVGTSSLRRAAQLHAEREDLAVVDLRGNVDTRLRKLADGECDAIVLARAGLVRLGRDQGVPLPWIPAPGQGVLALEGRADDERAREAARRLTDPGAEEALRAERAVAHTLGASCLSAFGAHAARRGEAPLTLRSWLGAPDGSAWLADEVALEDGEAPDALGRRAAERLLAAGAGELLGP
jgi:hydroxymethylbilane synthase